MTGRRTNSAADAAEPYPWASTLDEMTHDDMHVDNREDQIRNTFVRTVFHVIKISREKLRSLIQMEVKPAVETAQGEKMRRMARNLPKVTVCDVSTTWY